MSSIISNSDEFEQENMVECLEMILLVFVSNRTWFKKNKKYIGTAFPFLPCSSFLTY